MVVSPKNALERCFERGRKLARGLLLADGQEP
jgi:hypothetical protein